MLFDDFEYLSTVSFGIHPIGLLLQSLDIDNLLIVRHVDDAITYLICEYLLWPKEIVVTKVSQELLLTPFIQTAAQVKISRTHDVGSDLDFPLTALG